MKALIESILQGYGSLVTVRDGQSARTFRALVQPVTEKGLGKHAKAHRIARQGSEGAVCVYRSGRNGDQTGTDGRGPAGGVCRPAQRDDGAGR